jgi:uncharacterized RDD family membrane protein YckC
MLTNKKRRALHDFLAGTVVIKDAQPTKVVGHVDQYAMATKYK